MRADQFSRLLQKLKLRPASKRAAEAFGLSLRQLQRITSGKSPVPGPVALLAIAYSKFGVPERLWSPDMDRADAIASLDRDAILRTTILSTVASHTKPSPVIETPLATDPPAAEPVVEPGPGDLAADARLAKLQRTEKAADIAAKRFNRR